MATMIFRKCKRPLRAKSLSGQPSRFESAQARSSRSQTFAVLNFVLPALLLAISFGCAESGGEVVDFNSLPPSEAEIADASQQNVDVGIDPNGPVPGDVNTPPSEDDPFAAAAELNANQSADDEPDSTTGESVTTNPDLNSDAGDTDTTAAKTATESSTLSPMERMLRKRAVAIAKANGTEIPVFDDEDSGPREIELLVEDRTFKTEGPDGAIRVSFDDLDLLKVLNMSPVPTDAADHFPEWLSQLHGKTIRIRGFMYPTMRETGITKFRMARDNDICCFVKTPKIYDTARVNMKKDGPATYIEGYPFDVVGTFRIRPKAEFGELFELWCIDDAIIVRR